MDIHYRYPMPWIGYFDCSFYVIQIARLQRTNQGIILGQRYRARYCETDLTHFFSSPLCLPVEHNIIANQICLHALNLASFSIFVVLTFSASWSFRFLPD